jgi:hypothetical protein
MIPQTKLPLLWRKTAANKNHGRAVFSRFWRNLNGGRPKSGTAFSQIGRLRQVRTLSVTNQVDNICTGVQWQCIGSVLPTESFLEGLGIRFWQIRAQHNFPRDVHILATWDVNSARTGIYDDAMA